MGVVADGSNKAFPSKDVDAFLARPKIKIPIDFINTEANVAHFLLAVDPSGGGSSAFAVTSMAQLHTGQLLVRKNAKLLVFPHLRHHDSELHKRIWRLAAILQKSRNQKREHASLQVSAVVTLGKLPFATKRKEESGSTADYAVGCSRKPSHGLHLGYSLLSRRRGAVNLRQEINHPVQLRV
jgi:hypothetical protein